MIAVPAHGTAVQILDAALTLFTKQGYFNTSVPDIVRESGVSTGSIYHHFKGKEGVARAIYHKLMDEVDEAIESIYQQHHTARERCRESDPRAMEFMLYSKHREFLPDEKPICSSKPFELMRHIVSEGMERGEIVQIDPIVASTCLFGGAFRLISLRLDGILQEPLPAYLDEVWRCSWKAVST
jgi:AcrR family transcriptional regulator